jgi:hypothetical protein
MYVPRSMNTILDAGPGLTNSEVFLTNSKVPPILYLALASLSMGSQYSGG